MLNFLSDNYSIIITIILILVVLFCMFLIHKVTSLKEKVEILEIKNNYEKKVIVDKENTIPIKKISEEKKINNPIKKESTPIQIEPIYTEEPKINREFNINDYIPQKEDTYLEEVSKKLKEEIDNKPIPLTEFEKEEEKDAVISYKELINKEEKQNLDETSTEEFIDQLKKLRNSL